MRDDIASDVSAVSRIEAVPRILEVICRTTGLGFSAVARVTEAHWVACAVRDEIAFGLQPGGELVIGTTICDEIRRSGELVVINDVEADELFRGHPTPRRYGFKSYISVPIVLSGGRFFGTLCAIDPRPATLNKAETVEMFKLFAELIAHHLDAQQHLQATVTALSTEQQAGRFRDEFLATLAHELRNPLAPIRNGLQVLATTDRPDVRDRAVAMMGRQLGQLVRLVDDLMDVSRVSRGKLDLQREPVPLADVLASAVETSRPLIDQMGHELTYVAPDRGIVVDADLTRLAQVFLNLLNNAAKYMDRGGRIWLGAARHGDRVAVSVRDAGVGIAADQLPHIFDLFSQVDRSLEKAQGGLGIGLTLVRRLAEMHGGTVEVRSDGPGKGSEFVVRLPVVEAAAPVDGRAAEGPAAAPRRILIVDDNRDGADSLAEMMAIFGNDTRTAYDGEAAVAAAAAFRPEVILLDIGLPKLNGYEACRRIRALGSGPRPVIIAQTGWGAEEDRQRTRDAGFDHHLVKPVDPDALMTLLAEMQTAW